MVLRRVASVLIGGQDEVPTHLTGRVGLVNHTVFDHIPSDPFTFLPFLCQIVELFARLASSERLVLLTKRDLVGVLRIPHTLSIQLQVKAWVASQTSEQIKR
jgi:hypothetical protein